MAKLYLIRHGETEYNSQFRFQGQTDVALNEKGLKQADCLAKFFRNIPLDDIYTSPLKRARVTAEKIALEKGLEPIVDEDFREIGFGIWEGMFTADIEKKYRKHWQEFFAKPVDRPIEGGEDLVQVQKRAYTALKKMLSNYPDGNVALVAHGGIIRVLMITMLGMDLNRMWHLHVGNASTTCFYYWGNSYTLDFANMSYYLGDSPLELIL